MKKALCILSILFIVSALCCGQDLTSKKSQKARLEKEITLIENQLKDNSSKNASALVQLDLLRKKTATRSALIKESEKEIGILNDSIRVKVTQISHLKARLDTMNFYYRRLVKNAYKNRDARIWYMYLLASDNFGQASRRYGYLRSLATQMKIQARKIQEAEKELDAELERLKSLRTEAKSLMDANVKELGKLKSEEAQTNKLVTQLGKQKKKYQNELASKKKQVNALNREIERLISSQIGGSGNSGSAKKQSKPIDYKLAEEFEKNRGKLPWPCDGSVMGRFGKRTHPVYKSIEMPFSNGIDIAVAKGAPVNSVFNGEVKKIIVMPGYNKCVLVQHGSFFTFYCKLASVDVKAGDKIKTGQKIGTVDTIDGQTQVHFQLWEGNKPQDPEKWLRPL